MSSFSHYVFKSFLFQRCEIRDCMLKVALQILARKFYKNTKKSSLYFQSLLIFIHITPEAESHPKTIEVRDLLRPRSTPTGNMVYFYTSTSLIYSLKYTYQASNIAPVEDIMENNYMFVMLWNLSVISHKMIPQCFFFYFWRKI